MMANQVIARLIDGHEEMILLDDGKIGKKELRNYELRGAEFLCCGLNGQCRAKMDLFYGTQRRGFKVNNEDHHAQGCEYDETGKGGSPPREVRIANLDKVGDNLNMNDLLTDIDHFILSGDKKEKKKTPPPIVNPGPQKKEPKNGGIIIKDVYNPPKKPRELFDVLINKGLKESYAGVAVNNLIFCKDNFDHYIEKMNEDQFGARFCVVSRSYPPTKVEESQISTDTVDGEDVVWMRVFGENRKFVFIAIKTNNRDDFFRILKFLKKKRKKEKIVIVIYANDWTVKTQNDEKYLVCTVNKVKKQTFEYD